MIAATFDGIECWLLTAEHDWASAISAEFATQTARDLGLTQRESRVRLASATELTLSHSAKLAGAEAAALQRVVDTYDNRPVLMPYWPALSALADVADSPWSDNLRVFFEPDWSHWQIRAGAQEPDSFAPTAECLSAPLAWSRFGKLPAARLRTPKLHTSDISTAETGAASYAVAPRPLVLAVGPVVGGSARPVLPVAPDWHDDPQKGIEVRVVRKSLGHARGEAEEYYPHTPLGLQRAGFVLNASEAARMVEFFRQCGGMARPWWSPSWEEYTYLTAATSTAVLHVEAAALLGSCSAIAVVSPAGAIAVRGVVSIVGNTITLDSAPGAFPADSAVTPAQLCRFKADKLQLKYTTPNLAATTVEYVTLPTEGADILGYEGAAAALYLITDGAGTWRYTDHDAPIDAGALGVFVPKHIQCGTFSEELNLEEHGSTLELRHFAGNPFGRLIDRSSSGELNVSIYTCDPEVAGSAAPIFTAKAVSAKSTGPFLNVTLAGFEKLFDIKGSRQLMQDTCCAVLGDEKCQKPNPGVACTVAAATGATVDFVLPEPALDPAFLPCGSGERITAAGTQRWPIRSAAIVEGVLRVQFGGSIAPAPAAAETWTLYRGCLGTFAACQAHDNTINFRGFPYIPTRNPSITPVTSTTSGKK